MLGHRALWLTTAVVLAAACRTESIGSKDLTVDGLEEDIVDGDGDGFPADEDCNDAAPDVGPGIAEVCNGIDDDCDGEVDEDVKDTFYADADGDGFGTADDSVEACEAPTGYVPNDTDCDDAEPNAFPGNIEVCDELDNDCDTEVDEDLGGAWYIDSDGDGFGDPDTAVEACEAPSGYVDNADDCDDGYDDTYPGADELCDERDNDCDSDVDEDLLLTWYKDEDGDGWGIPSETTESCLQPVGYAGDNGDCDDGNPDVYPTAAEVCNGIDDNCDLLVDDDDPTVDTSTGAIFYRDADADTYGDAAATVAACVLPTGYSIDATDCDDSNDAVNPAATEVCNSIDDDCDSLVDDDDTSVDTSTGSTYYRDGDSDTYGDASSTIEACSLPSGYVTDSTDCDDGSRAVNPAATEECNSIDDDCDGLVDDDDSSLDTSTGSTYYRDADADTYGDASTTIQACLTPSGYVSDTSDCDDTSDAVNPAATEVCNSIDDDCDSLVDDDDGSVDTSTGSTYFRDGDSDTYGDASSTIEACSLPSGYVTDSTDCDDGSRAVNPAATEECNSIDDDCDGLVDDDDSSLDTSTGSTYYRDADADTYGDASTTIQACLTPSGYVSDTSDCDDGSRAVNPAATEVCNSIDDDCDGLVDDDDGSVDTSTGRTYYRDGDSDTYGDASSTIAACSVPSGYVTNASDCDDTTGSVNPGATEVCNSIDDDCDSLVDDDDGSLDGSTGTTYYRDADSDRYGNPSSTLAACTLPGGYVTNALDCDDTDGSVNPAATEICFDGLDNDCSGSEDDSSACYLVDFTSDASDVNLWEEAGYPSTAVTIYVTVASGVTIDSTDPSIPALTTDGFATGSTVYIENLGTIHGRGGDGACSSGGSGEDGGDAIEVTVDVELDTSVGGVYGGGGGGGAGDDPTGGGGGAGNGVGCSGGGNASGGVGGHGPQRFSSNPGGDGNNYNGSYGYGGSWGTPGSSGSGGSGGSGGDGSCLAGQGGAGGGWGGGGGGGYACSSGRNPGNGGEAGWAVRVLSGSITITGGNDTTHVKGWVN